MGEAKRRRKREEHRLASGTGTAAPESPPEPYSHMTAADYWNMLIGEDPDDRAIREAHGIGYREDRAVTCRYGCGATYDEIAVGKRRKCEARPSGPENVPRFAAGGIVATGRRGSDEVPVILSRGCVMPPPLLPPSLTDKLNAREPEE